MTPFSISSTPEEFSPVLFAIAAPVLNVVAYVVMVITGSLCIFFLARQLKPQRSRSGAAASPDSDSGMPAPSLSRRHAWFYLVYVVCMACFGTAYTASLQVDIAQPRHANACQRGEGKAPTYNVVAFAVSNSAFALSGGFSDVLVVWRCCVIYRESSWCQWVKALCWLLFASDCLIGVTAAVMYSVPSVGDSTIPVVLAQSSFTISTTLNLVCTALIVGRLYSVKKYFTDTMGSTDRSQLRYATISAMLIESCALYATLSVTLLVLWFLRSPASFVAFALLGQCQIISVFLVILRVSRGVAWTRAPDLSAVVDLDFAEFCKVDLPGPGPSG